MSILATTWSSHSQHWWTVTETVYLELCFICFSWSCIVFKFDHVFERRQDTWFKLQGSDKTCARIVIPSSKTTYKAAAFSHKEYNSRNIFVIKQLGYYGKVPIPLKISCMPSVLKKLENRFFKSHRYWLSVISNCTGQMYYNSKRFLKKIKLKNSNYFQRFIFFLS